MFVNKTEALKQVIERINLVLAKKFIVDEFDISKLLAKIQSTAVHVRTYDTAIENETLYDLLESKIKQAIRCNNYRWKINKRINY